SQGGKGAGGPAELKGEKAGARFAQTFAMAAGHVEPAHRLEPEAHGRRMLKPGSPGQGCPRVSRGQSGKTSGQPGKIFVDHRENVTQLQDKASIDGVLAGRAPMDELRRLLFGPSDQGG